MEPIKKSSTSICKMRWVTFISKSRPSISRIIKFSIVFYFPPCLLFSIQFLYEIGIILIHRFIWPIAPHKKHRIIWWDIQDYTHFLVLYSSYILMWSKIYFFAWICITTFYGTISIIVKYAFTKQKKNYFWSRYYTYIGNLI